MKCCHTYCKCFFASFCPCVAFLGRVSLTQQVGASLWPHPAALHTSQGRTITACQTQADINNKSWSRNHSQEHKRDTERRCGLCLALLQVPSFDTCPDGSLMGAHGVTRVYVHVYMCVYIASMVFMHSPPTLFSSLWRGIFLWQAASEKAIKNSQTAHHNGRYHLCNVSSISLAVLVWNGFGYF